MRFRRSEDMPETGFAQGLIWPNLPQLPHLDGAESAQTTSTTAVFVRCHPGEIFHGIHSIGSYRTSGAGRSGGKDLPNPPRHPERVRIPSTSYGVAHIPLQRRFDCRTDQLLQQATATRTATESGSRNMKNDSRRWRKRMTQGVGLGRKSETPYTPCTRSRIRASRIVYCNTPHQKTT